MSLHGQVAKKNILQAVETDDFAAVQLCEISKNANEVAKALEAALARGNADIARWIIDKGGLTDIFLFSLDTTGAQTLAKILENDNIVTSLLISRGKFSELGAKSIAQMLSKNKNIQAFNISYTPLNQEALKSLIAAFENHPSLIRLGLSIIEMDKPNALALAEVLKNKTLLKRLNLISENISNEAVLTVLSALELNKTLASLSVPGNLSNQEMEIASDYISKNETLKFLEIYFNGGFGKTMLDLNEFKKFSPLKRFLDGFYNAVQQIPAFQQMSFPELLSYCKENLISPAAQALIQSDPLFALEMISSMLKAPDYREYQLLITKLMFYVVSGEDLTPVIVPAEYYQRNAPPTKIDELAQSGIGWRLCMNGVKDQLKTVSKYDAKEPGSLAAIAKGFTYALQTVDEPLKFRHIINTKDLCEVDPLNNKAPYRDSTLVWIPLGDYIKEEHAARCERICDPNRGSDFSLSSKISPRLAGQPLLNRVNEVLDNYNRCIAQAYDSALKLSLIVDMVYILIHIHPFDDKNCRTLCSIILNRELIRHGFPFTLYDSRRLYSKKEWMQEIIAGFKRYEDALLDGKQNELAPEAADRQLITNIQEGFRVLREKRVEASVKIGVEPTRGPNKRKVPSFDPKPSIQPFQALDDKGAQLGQDGSSAVKRKLRLS